MNNDIESILQQAFETKSRINSGSVARAKNRSQARRMNAPKIGQANTCCDSCEEKPLGPYRIGQYHPSLDAWDATCINTGFQFYGKPLNNGAMGTGDVLMGFPDSPTGGLLNPKKGKSFTRTVQPVTSPQKITIEIRIGYTGKYESS